MKESEMPVALSTYASGSGEPLLLIHGSISDASFYSEAAPSLARAFRVLRYDRRGYGGSKPYEGKDYSIRAQALDAVRVMEQAGIGDAWIAGHSGGALVGLEVLRCFPERVKGLLMVEPAMAFPEELRRELQEWDERMKQCLREHRWKKAFPLFADLAGGKTAFTGKGGLEDLKTAYENLWCFLNGEIDAIAEYRPAEAEIARITKPVVVFVSELGENALLGRAAVDTAHRFSWPLMRLPGYHNTPKDHPEEFSAMVAGTIHLLRCRMERGII